VRTWYGWQIILIDGASLVVLLAGQGQSLPSGLAGIGYVAGGPTVHFAHGHVGKGFGSAGLRLGLPFAGALLGLAIGAGQSCNGCELTPALEDFAIGLLLGLVAAPVIDVAWLAYDEEPPHKAKDALLSAPSLRIQPAASLPRDAAGRFAPTLGLTGSF
jgi:hypothetical protein